MTTGTLIVEVDNVWSNLQCTWPANALVQVDAVHADSSILARVGSTFKNMLFTVVPYKSRPFTVTRIAGKKHKEHNTKKVFVTHDKMPSNKKCQHFDIRYIMWDELVNE